MAMDLKNLSKLESPSASVQAEAGTNEDHLLVVVKLHEGYEQPDYVETRAEFGPLLFSAEIEQSDLERLEADPAVESVSLSRRLTVID